MLQESKNVRLFGEQRLMEPRRRVGELGDVEDEQEQVGDVNLPAAPQDPRRRDDEPVLLDRAAVDQRGRIPGNEDEDFAGVAQAVIADRDPADDVRGNVIEKDQPERQSAEEIQTQVAPGNGGSPCNGQHG